MNIEEARLRRSEGGVVTLLLYERHCTGASLLDRFLNLLVYSFM